MSFPQSDDIHVDDANCCTSIRCNKKCYSEYLGHSTLTMDSEKQSVQIFLNGRPISVVINRILLLLIEAAGKNIQAIANDHLIHLGTPDAVNNELANALITEIADSELLRRLDSTDFDFL